jgi:hypothetical protein
MDRLQHMVSESIHFLLSCVHVPLQSHEFTPTQSPNAFTHGVMTPECVPNCIDRETANKGTAAAITPGLVQSSTRRKRRGPSGRGSRARRTERRLILQHPAPTV